jgi:cytosine/adenosine deaminase-related metal-dependent hydrolase
MAGTVQTLPVEVELALEVMPCQAMRRTYDGAESPHPCAHFAEWGRFHSFDYDEEGPPPKKGVIHPSAYAGKRPLVPEILSGCRKAPILAVGINPNLPGWNRSSRNAIHPYFDDYLQYAHYFRWRATEKLRIPMEQFDALLGGADDGPFVSRGLVETGTEIPVEPAPVTMYDGYQSLLDRLAERMGWADHKLTVGEDIAYANMVACGSARWTTRPVSGDPSMPVMGEARARGIVKECFHDRKYFLRQMLQTLPRVVLVFSQTTADAFLLAMRGRFTKGDPRPGEPIADLLEREIRLRFGESEDGEILDARVVFSPHVSARPDDFAQALERIVDHLVAEAEAGKLTLNTETGRLHRPRGGCRFCSNALYRIGTCDYVEELRPLAGADIEPLADDPTGILAERNEQARLLREFAPATRPEPDGAESDVTPFDDAAPSAPRLALRGKIVRMSGPVIDDGVIYLQRGSIVAVLKPSDAAPEGFAGVAVTDTGGVIYPGFADLHNHLAYNILSLWWPARKSTNRAQWLGNRDYKRNVGMVMDVIVGRQDLVKALIRYVEVKLILGGVTSGQGMTSKYRRSEKLYPGLVRNFETPDDDKLPEIGHLVPDLQNRPEKIASFRRGLEGHPRFFFHLAEGTDERARSQFTLLADNALVKASLVGIHSLGLKPEDYAALADAGARIVWSPLSNSILYGETLPIKDVLAAGLPFALGSDWTPSGSRNILQELKVAALAAKAQGVALPNEQLARAITVEAQEIAGWGKQLGKIEPEAYADLTVLDGIDDDPYDNLVKSTEKNVRLVIIAGHARYGDRDLMTALGAKEATSEPIEVGGRDRLLSLHHPSSPLNHISFAAARDALAAALADLPAARDATVFEPFDDAEALEVELDMQPPEPEWGEVEELAEVTLPDSVPFDTATIVDDPDYWNILDTIPHLPAYLKGEAGLRSFYE